MLILLFPGPPLELCLFVRVPILSQPADAEAPTWQKETNAADDASKRQVSPPRVRTGARTRPLPRPAVERRNADSASPIRESEAS